MEIIRIINRSRGSSWTFKGYMDWVRGGDEHFGFFCMVPLIDF